MNKTKFWLWVSQIDFQTDQYSCIIKAGLFFFFFKQFTHLPIISNTRGKIAFTGHYFTFPLGAYTLRERHFEQEHHLCKAAYNSPHFVVLHVEDVSSLVHLYLTFFVKIQKKIYLQIDFYKVTLKMSMLEENTVLVHFSMLHLWLDKLLCHIKTYISHSSKIVHV